MLDNETGTIPGIGLKAGTSLYKHFNIDFGFEIYGGDVYYTGYTQSGSPFTTQTYEVLSRYSIKASTEIINDISLFASTTLHQWDRDIYGKNGTAGLFEVYKWRELAIGISMPLWKQEQSTLSIEASVLKIKKPEMYIDLSESGYGYTDLILKEDDGARIKIHWSTENDDLAYGISLFYEMWEFGKSDSNTTTGGTSSISVFEPRSETRHSGIQFTLEFNY